MIESFRPLDKSEWIFIAAGLQVKGVSGKSTMCCVNIAIAASSIWSLIGWVYLMLIFMTQSVPILMGFLKENRLK